MHYKLCIKYAKHNLVFGLNLILESNLNYMSYFENLGWNPLI